MIVEPLIFSVFAFIATSLGGVFAIRYKEKLHYIMAFAAGVLLSIVSFDILPEIIDQVKEHNFHSIDAMIALAGGFLLFHILEKIILIRHSDEKNFAAHKHPHVGVFSALALAGHSFIDGVGIGLGFQINAALGIFIALAVLAHDFTDGMNTVTFMVVHKNTDKKTLWLLILDAVTPILGVLSTLLFKVPPYVLFLYLGFFAGFLLYIGASDILPEAHSENSSYALVGLTVLGALFIFVITRFI
jgi:zinc transporter ZupT